MIAKSFDHDLQLILVKILGENAINNGMELDKSISLLCKAVKYLFTQLPITATLGEDASAHVEKVFESTIQILSPALYNTENE